MEAGVRFAQSYILGRLRNVTFFSLAECNTAIGVALERMNGREIRRLGVSRRQLFETIERPAMQSLPEQDYEYAEWHFARVGIDYHVEAEGFFYSVPNALIREQVDTRITTRTIEIFHRGKRVASHARRYGGPRHGTCRWLSESASIRRRVKNRRCHRQPSSVAFAEAIHSGPSN